MREEEPLWGKVIGWGYAILGLIVFILVLMNEGFWGLVAYISNSR